MSDYVSRDAVVKWVDDSIEMCGNQYTTEQENMMEMFRTVITDCIPAADVRTVPEGGAKMTGIERLPAPEEDEAWTGLSE